MTKITDKMDEATRRSLIRENEAAETIAKNGYNIEQDPVIEGTTRNPDYLIEGEIFDCYSPAENTKVGINNPDGGKNISQVQVSPEGGRHAGGPERYLAEYETDRGKHLLNGECCVRQGIKLL